jgi:hypothetical protein
MENRNYCESCQCFRMKLKHGRDYGRFLAVGLAVLIGVGGISLIKMQFFVQEIVNLGPIWIFLATFPIMLFLFLIIVVISLRNLQSIDFQDDSITIWKSSMGSRIPFSKIRSVRLHRGKNPDYNESDLERRPYTVTVQMITLTRFSGEATLHDARQIVAWSKGRSVKFILDITPEELAETVV